MQLPEDWKLPKGMKLIQTLTFPFENMKTDMEEYLLNPKVWFWKLKNWQFRNKEKAYMILKVDTKLKEVTRSIELWHIKKQKEQLNK